MENDGCTFWFDTWRGIDLSGCCAEHDDAFAISHSLTEYLSANVDLLLCSIHLGAWDWGVMAFIGVMSPVGAYLFFLGKKRSEPTQNNRDAQ